MYDKSWGTDASVLSSRFSEFQPSQMGVECNAREDVGGRMCGFQRAVGAVVRVLDVLSRSGRLDSYMACLRGDYGCSSWKSTGGITEVFPRGFPSVRGLRIMVNAFLPIRPDATSVKHVIGKDRHRVGFAGEWRDLYSRSPPYVLCLLDRMKARHDNKFIVTKELA